MGTEGDSTPEHGPQWSPDRAWWWDGKQWLPASQAPQPPLEPEPPLPPPPPAPQPSVPPSMSAPRRGGGVPGWLAVVGLVFCFPVGIVLTLLTRWSVRTKAIAIGIIVGLAIIGGVGTAISSSNQNSPTASGTQSSPTESQAAQGQSPKATASAKSPAPSPSPKPHFITFGSGTLVVNKDVQPGTYRTRHDSPGCYFARLKGFGGTVDDIIANDNTDATVVVTIAAGDAGFQSTRCDQWSSDLSQITTSKTSFGDGDHIVGTDMDPGTYRNTGVAGCYYARVRGWGHTIDDIIANDNTDAQAVVTIAATDAGFESQRCGTWTKIG